MLLAGEGDLETERGRSGRRRERERDFEGVRETDLGEGRRRNRQTVLQGYDHTYCKVAGWTGSTHVDLDLGERETGLESDLERGRGDLDLLEQSRTAGLSPLNNSSGRPEGHWQKKNPTNFAKIRLA